MDSDKEAKRYEMPYEEFKKKAICPCFVWEPELFLSEFWYPQLEGGLQPGDIDLFVGEEWVTSQRYSCGVFTGGFLHRNPNEKKKALEFARRIGIQKLADMLDYYESEYSGHIDDERMKWKYILTEIPALQRLFNRYIWHESVDDSVERILKIKQKLKRMPSLNASYKDGCITVSDTTLPSLHPRDSAILGILGMNVGIVILRSSDED